MIIARQSVLVHKPEVVDDWGEVSPFPPITMKCRAEEKTQIVKNTLGDEVVSSAELIFRKLPNIAYDDVIEYTNELNVSIKRKPLLISHARKLNSKVYWTSVYL